MNATLAQSGNAAGEAARKRRRIVLATWGSFGDLHPFIGVGLGLKERGHEVLLASTNIYRDKVLETGLEFHAIRPDMPPAEEVRAMIRRIMDPKMGSKAVIKEGLMPFVRDQYLDLAEACRGADVLLNHPIVHSGPVVAEKLGIPFVDCMLQPMLMLSRYEPPVPPEMPALAALYKLGPGFNGWFMKQMKKSFRSWSEPVDRLRAELGLKPAKDPIFEDHFSPDLNLALFSEMLGAPQPDWPPHTISCGFPFYDRLTHGSTMPPNLQRFLDSGPAPIVFTLGTSAVFTADDFYRESITAVQKMGRRAVLLVGTEGLNELPSLPAEIIGVPYAPHSGLFARAAAIVHQGGVGTTGQALRSGKPTLVVPFAHDQPDNATRVTRRGGARWILRSRYNAATAERELRLLLEDPAYARNAEEVGRKVRAEDGVRTACDAVESLLRPKTGLGT
jgi:rhamnosyltransferase subunit B